MQQNRDGPHIQLPAGHHVPVSSPLIHAPPAVNGPGYTPEHQDYLLHREYRARLAYTTYRAAVGAVEARLVESKGMKDVLIRVSSYFNVIAASPPLTNM